MPISIKLEIWEVYWECPIDEDNTTRDHTVYLGSPSSSSIFLPRASVFGWVHASFVKGNVTRLLWFGRNYLKIFVIFPPMLAQYLEKRETPWASFSSHQYPYIVFCYFLHSLSKQVWCSHTVLSLSRRKTLLLSTLEADIRAVYSASPRFLVLWVLYGNGSQNYVFNQPLSKMYCKCLFWTCTDFFSFHYSLNNTV